MFKLLAERLSGESAPSYSNKAMEFGVEYEPQARAYYESLYGGDTQLIQQIGFAQLSEYVGCSPDGLIGDDGIIEIKYPFPSTHLSYILKNKLPAIYKPQVQGNLWVMNREWCDFVSFNAKIKSRPFWMIRVHRDEGYIQTLSNAVGAFVNEMIKLEGKIINQNDF